MHLNGVYRSLTTHKKAGAEKLPKYENLSLINQNLREEMEFSLPEMNFHDEFWNMPVSVSHSPITFLPCVQTEPNF